MSKLRVVPTQLARKVTLAFGFLAFIPLLLIVWASVSFIFPHLQDSQQSTLRLMIMAIIASIFLGYVVLKRTMGAVMEVVQQAKAVSRRRRDEPSAGTGQDELGELARTFHRITQELEGKIHELESSRALIKRLLSRIGTAIVSYEGIDHLLELIVENAALALEAQQGSLLLMDGERQVLTVKAAWSLAPEDAGPSHREQEMALGEGIAGWVAKERTAMRSTGLPASIGLAASTRHEGAVLCVPLMLRDNLLGVLAVLREELARPFTDDDQVLLANIGSQIAVAIENYRLNLDIERTYLETVTALALAVEAKEAYTAGHSKRVAWYAVQIAEAMGLDEETKKMLQYGGTLHDVGKIGIKDGILLKGEHLTPEERQIMQQHPRIGEAILKPLRSLATVAEMVRCHHERYDGSGYPHGLKGEAIPLTARLLTVADAYDAMVTDRPYRKRMSLEEAMVELRHGAGVQFDPQVIAAFVKVLSSHQHQ